MNDLITVVSKLPVLEVDFVAAELRLQKELLKYDVVVTVDTLKETKKLCADLNKMADNIDTLRKDKVKEVSGPVKEFDTKMKSLVALCKTGRTKLTDQVSKFESETLINARAALDKELAAQYLSNAVAKIYQKASMQGLPRLNTLTGTGKLSKKAKDEVTALVLADKGVQDRAKIRELELVSRCEKAGIPVLTRVHLKDVILLDDDIYNARVIELVEAEIERQEAVDTTTIDEPVPMVQTAKGPVEVVPAGEPVSLDYGEEDPNQLADDSDIDEPSEITWDIVATFRVTIPSSVDRQQVRNKFEEVFNKAGMKSLVSIGVSVV